MKIATFNVKGVRTHLPHLLRWLVREQPDVAFWDYFRQHWQRNAGLRIDHLLLNRHLAPALRSAGVHTWVRGEDKASDHAPTWIALETAAEAPPRPRKRSAPKKNT